MHVCFIDNKKPRRFAHDAVFFRPVKNPGNKGSGYRQGRSDGQGKKLELRIPRDRYGNFHPQILAILRDQE